MKHRLAQLLYEDMRRGIVDSAFDAHDLYLIRVQSVFDPWLSPFFLSAKGQTSSFQTRKQINQPRMEHGSEQMLYEDMCRGIIDSAFAA